MAAPLPRPSTLTGVSELTTRTLKGRETAHGYRYSRAGDDCDTGPTGAAVLHTFGLTAGILEDDDRWTLVVALGGAAPARG
jgi:hypothetical protein